MYHVEPLIMKQEIRRACTALLLTALFALGACDSGHIEGNGILRTTRYYFEGFTAVNAESGYSVVLSHDTAYAVQVTTDSNLMFRLDVYRSGSVLNLKIKPRTDASFTALTADVRMPQIKSLQLSSGSSCVIDTGFRSNDPMDVVLSSGSNAEGSLKCGKLGLTLSSGSNTSLSGAGTDGNIICSSGSVANLRYFVLTNVVVTASSGSAVYVHANGRLDVTASGGSKVYYSGNAQLGTINLSDGSTLERIN